QGLKATRVQAGYGAGCAGQVFTDLRQRPTVVLLKDECLARAGVELRRVFQRDRSAPDLAIPSQTRCCGYNACAAPYAKTLRMTFTSSLSTMRTGRSPLANSCA